MTSGAVLGSFDPLALIPSFSGRYLPETLDPDGPRHTETNAHSLSLVPSSVLAHELAHLTHTLSTAAGIREYLLSVTDLNLRGLMLLAAASVSEGHRLHVPLSANESRYSRSKAYAALRHELALLRRAIGAHNGSRADLTPVAAGAAAWIDQPGDVKGEVSWEVPFFNFERYTGAASVTTTGFIHLTEGAAKIVERIQRRLSGEPGEQSPLGADATTLEGFANEVSSPIDPYYVASLTFAWIRANVNPRSSRAPYEEYVLALADMAMMFDPLVTPDNFARLYGINDPEMLAGACIDFSPFATFIRLSMLFWRRERRLPPLEAAGSLTERLLAIENALLREIRPDLTMADVTDECLHSTPTLLAKMGPTAIAIDAPGVQERIHAAFTNALGKRRDALGGVGFIEQLIVGREVLLRLLDALAPSFCVGTVIASTADTQPGRGVGVDQQNLQALRDLLDAMIDGQMPCFFAEGVQDRQCPRAPIELCQALPSRLRQSGAPHCVRESLLRSGHGAHGEDRPRLVTAEFVIEVEREEAVRAIQPAMSGGLPSELQEQLSRAIVDVFEEHGEPRTLGPRHARLRRWVIRDEDLDVTRSVTDALASLLAARYLIPTSNWAPITALVLSLLRAARKVHERGVRLAPDDLVLVLAIRARPGVTTSDLAALVTTDTVAALRRLSAYPTPGGEVVALVRQAGDEGWYAAV